MGKLIRNSLVMLLLMTVITGAAYPLVATGLAQVLFPAQANGSLVTKDGKAAFVEKQTARNDAEHSYSYAFLSSPLPVSNYTSTIKVVAKDDGNSTVIWSGSYTPDLGKEKAASEALNGVYEAGLAEIKARLGK